MPHTGGFGGSGFLSRIKTKRLLKERFGREPTNKEIAYFQRLTQGRRGGALPTTRQPAGTTTRFRAPAYNPTLPQGVLERLARERGGSVPIQGFGNVRAEDVASIQEFIESNWWEDDLTGVDGGGPLPLTPEELELIRAQTANVRGQTARDQELAYLQAIDRRLAERGLSLEEEISRGRLSLDQLLGAGQLKLGLGQLELDKEELAQTIALERDRLAQTGRFTERELDLREQELAQRFGIEKEELEVARGRLELDKALGFGQLELGRGQLALEQRSQLEEERAGLAERAANPRRFLETLFYQGGRNPSEAASSLQNLSGLPIRAHRGGTVLLVGDKGMKGKTRGTEEFVYAPEGTVVAPIPAGKRPTMSLAKRLIDKQVQRAAKGYPSKSKARKILHDKKVRGKKLTPKQQRFFGLLAGGRKPTRAQGGGIVLNIGTDAITTLKGTPTERPPSDRGTPGFQRPGFGVPARPPFPRPGNPPPRRRDADALREYIRQVLASRVPGSPVQLGREISRRPEDSQGITPLPSLLDRLGGQGQQPRPFRAQDGASVLPDPYTFLDELARKLQTGAIRATDATILMQLGFYDLGNAVLEYITGLGDATKLSNFISSTLANVSPPDTVVNPPSIVTPPDVPAEIISTPAEGLEGLSAYLGGLYRRPVNVDVIQRIMSFVTSPELATYLQSIYGQPLGVTEIRRVASLAGLTPAPVESPPVAEKPLLDDPALRERIRQQFISATIEGLQGFTGPRSYGREFRAGGSFYDPLGGTLFDPDAIPGIFQGIFNPRPRTTSVQDIGKLVRGALAQAGPVSDYLYGLTQRDINRFGTTQEGLLSALLSGSFGEPSDYFDLKQRELEGFQGIGRGVFSRFGGVID